MIPRDAGAWVCRTYRACCHTLCDSLLELWHKKFGCVTSGAYGVPLDELYCMVNFKDLLVEMERYAESISLLSMIAEV